MFIVPKKYNLEQIEKVYPKRNILKSKIDIYAETNYGILKADNTKAFEMLLEFMYNITLNTLEKASHRCIYEKKTSPKNVFSIDPDKSISVRKQAILNNQIRNYFNGKEDFKSFMCRTKKHIDDILSSYEKTKTKGKCPFDYLAKKSEDDYLRL